MFPTSSRTFFVGRNARSATARIKSARSSRRSVQPRARLTRVSLRERALPQDQVLTVACVASSHAWYVQPRGERLESEEQRVDRRDRGVADCSLPAGGGRPPGRKRAERQLHRRGPGRELPRLAAARRSTRSLVIAVRNTGTKTIPNIAVTIMQSRSYAGTAAQAFGTAASPRPHMPCLASHSRPIWIIDRPPGPCAYSCLNGRPGRGRHRVLEHVGARARSRRDSTATFDWGVTVGRHHASVQSPPAKRARRRSQRQVAAGLDGKAKARARRRPPAIGSFRIARSASAASAVTSDSRGQIITTRDAVRRMLSQAARLPRC